MLFDTKGHCFDRDIIMLNVRWYLSYVNPANFSRRADKRNITIKTARYFHEDFERRRVVSGRGSCYS
jgi:hypothetical protein